MTGEERREKLYKVLNNHTAVSGTDLAKKLGVSRQIIVQDIALLRKSGSNIISTTKGYLLEEDDHPKRVFKLFHSPDRCEEELNLIVDNGGRIVDVFIYHKVYNVVRADMNVRSRKDVAEFMEQIRTGKSHLLSTATSGYHYHTVSADTDILCIYADGHFEIMKSGEKSGEELINEGVWQAFCFGPGLIEDGEITVSESDEVGRAMASNPRTAVGIIDELHYVFVVSDGRTSASEGLSLSELAAFMKSLGVQTAYNLDGGGSSTMYYQGEVVNNPTTTGHGTKERSVSDIVYIGY